MRTFSRSRWSSGTGGLPVMSMRLVSTLRTWIARPFGTARTFIVFGAMKETFELSAEVPREPLDPLLVVLRADTEVIARPGRRRRAAG